jgi:hypothetical protein
MLTFLLGGFALLAFLFLFALALGLDPLPLLFLATYPAQFRHQAVH